MSRADASPRRFIFNDVDMKHFMESSTKKGLLNFVEAMGKSCASSNAPFDSDNALEGMTPAMACLHGALRQMLEWVDEFPPVNADKARFGNSAFRTWHKRLTDRSNAIITAILLARDKPDIPLTEASQSGFDAANGNLDVEEDPSIKQVSAYLHDAFGHAMRLDYGTGHESSFVVFMFVLSKVACFGTEAPSLHCLRAITLAIFDQYLKVTRKIQTIYRLEPAGSHGVWGLDDYHCLPFYFGACQLSTKLADASTETLPFDLKSPTCINSGILLDQYADSYLFLGCIRYIRELKKGVPFFESSPMLYDISQTVAAWEKVSRGMLRMYEGEVLDKRQVVQHFLFGNYFPATWEASQSERVAPLSTFRETTVVGSGQNRVNTDSAFAGGRAPWANKTDAATTTTSDGDSNFVPTKAPWAK